MNVVRDWSFAPDILPRRMANAPAERPEDCILASGAGHTFAEISVAHLGLPTQESIHIYRGERRAANPSSAAHMA
jgi:GDP-D-mannose dehydratase